MGGDEEAGGVDTPDLQKSTILTTLLGPRETLSPGTGDNASYFHGPLAPGHPGTGAEMTTAASGG